MAFNRLLPLGIAWPLVALSVYSASLGVPTSATPPQSPAINQHDPEILKKAQTGDPYSQFWVGSDSEKQGDLADAFQWYRKAAEQGDPNAENALGFFFQWGRGAPQSFVEAVKWYRKSAEQGNPDGESNLAKMLVDGTGTKQDFAAAAAWYSKSAEQGWAWGQAMLAQMSAIGQGIPVDRIGAYKWCILAFEVEPPGQPWGCKKLLEDLSSKMKPEEIAEAKHRAYSWFEDRSKEPTKKHWVVGPDVKFVYAPPGRVADEWKLAGLIGLSYSEGEGVALDDAEAVKWFSLGSQRGDAPAESYLGERYYLGKGVPKDYDHAFKLFKQSADQGLPNGEHNLATCYADGIGVKKDWNEAAKWFQKASEGGNRDSAHDLGGRFAMGQGVTKDYATGYMWLRVARALGDNDSNVWIVAAYLTKAQLTQANQRTAEWFTAHSEDVQFQTELAYMYWRGEGVPKDSKKAAGLALPAAKNGNARAQSLTGMLYGTGDGVQKDDSEAVKWFRMAAEQGDTVGQTFLGLHYDNGRGVDKNPAEAIHWYQMAVEHEDAGSDPFNNLAWLYATASDPRLRNPSLALRYALKAVELTDAKDAGVLDTLAEAYYVNGDYENAIQTEKKALALEPKDSFRTSLQKYEQARQQKPR